MKLAIVTNAKYSPIGWASTPARVENIVRILKNGGLDVSVLDIPNLQTLYSLNGAIEDADLVWPNAYHFDSERDEPISLPGKLEKRGAKLIGPGEISLELMLDKRFCQKKLGDYGVPIPKYVIINDCQNINGKSEDEIALIRKVNLSYPLFCKPAVGFASSQGILIDAVQYNEPGIVEKINELRRRYSCPIIVEECIEGPEFTVAVIGNGSNRKIYATTIEVKDGRKILDETIKVPGLRDDLVSMMPITDEVRYQSLTDLANKVCEALDIRDFTRFDGKFDRNGVPRVFDVNGMPGLSTETSYSVHLFYSIFQENSKPEVFKRLIHSIVSSGASRLNVNLPPGLNEQLYR